MTSGGTAGAAGSGSYSFRFDLKGHVITRYSVSASCKGPADFDCDHSDSLYIYLDAPGGPLKAIYFDNEGHVIHYAVTTPAPNRVEFVSPASQTGPRFRLSYELKGTTMEGRFQMRSPGQGAFKSYLEWSGKKQGGAPVQR